MIFKLQIQYDLWLAKRKPDEVFSWGHTSREIGSPIETEQKLWKNMDEEEREAAFRREVYSTIHQLLL